MIAHLSRLIFSTQIKPMLICEDVEEDDTLADYDSEGSIHSSDMEDDEDNEHISDDSY